MPIDQTSYTSNEYITLDQLVGELSKGLSKLVKSRQRPLIKELNKRGMTYQQIADLLGMTRQNVYLITKEQDETK